MSDEIVMPRYFFHIRDADELQRDDEGAELPDSDAARGEGIASAKELVASALMEGMPLDQVLKREFEVVDEAGRPILTVPFAEAAQADDHRPSKRR